MCACVNRMLISTLLGGCHLLDRYFYNYAKSSKYMPTILTYCRWTCNYSSPREAAAATPILKADHHSPTQYHQPMDFSTAKRENKKLLQALQNENKLWKEQPSSRRLPFPYNQTKFSPIEGCATGRAHQSNLFFFKKMSNLENHYASHEQSCRDRGEA
jgi:hypothetical protein